MRIKLVYPNLKKYPLRLAICLGSFTGILRCNLYRSRELILNSWGLSNLHQFPLTAICLVLCSQSIIALDIQKTNTVEMKEFCIYLFSTCQCYNSFSQIWLYYILDHSFAPDTSSKSHFVTLQFLYSCWNHPCGVEKIYI